jgi:uncharacterized membrane protein
MLRDQVREVFIVQGAITGLCMVFTPQIVDVINLSPEQVPLLRVCLLGAFLQILLLLVIIVLFYFDLRKRVLFTTLFFLLSNAGLTWCTIRMGPLFYGYGYCFACFISVLLAFKFLSNALDNLEYITIAKQPIA